MSGLRIARGFSLPLDVVTEAVGIVAVRGAGKTYTSVVLIEEAHAADVPSVVIDATGVYHGLRTAADGHGDGLPFYVFGGQHGDLPLEPQHGQLIADVVVDSGHSFVLDLSDFSKTKARQFVAEFLERLYERKARNRTPLLLVADEADEWAPQKPRGEAARCLGAMEQIAKRGRSRGVGVVLITQRTQAINKDVLDLIETLFAMRISAPRSRQTVQEWLAVKEATDELGVIDSLSSLPTGTAWVWSPVRGILEKVAVRRIRTFDSYETPRPGRDRPEPGSRASLDLEALGEQMRTTVERARENDPAELRRRIRDLEEKNFKLNALPQIELMEWARRLFAPLGIKEPREGSVAIYLDLIEKRVAEITVEPKQVEVPVLADFPVDEFQAMCARLSEYGKRLDGGAEQMFDQFVRVKEMIEKGAVSASRAAMVPSDAAVRSRISESGRTERAKAPAKAERRLVAGGSGVDGESNGTVSNPEQRILDGLAWLEALGIRPGDRVQVAFLAGYKPKGGYFGNLLGGLRSGGWIDYPQSGTVELTDQGAPSPSIRVSPGRLRRSTAQSSRVSAARRASSCAPYLTSIRTLSAARGSRTPQATIRLAATSGTCSGRYARSALSPTPRAEWSSPATSSSHANGGTRRPEARTDR